MGIGKPARSCSHIPSTEGFYLRMVPTHSGDIPSWSPSTSKSGGPIPAVRTRPGRANSTNAGLAETVGCSPATLKRSLSRLEDAGFLVGESKPHRTIRLRPRGWENAPRPFKLKTFAG